MKKYLMPFGILLLFESIAVVLWTTTDNIFYLFNFTYLGTCIAFGIVLYIKKIKYARNFIQFAVGLYMLVYLGIIRKENMQIEGFWYYIFLGVFEAAVIHYFVAKIAGPLVFGRGWCGYACWTAMVFDLLPYKIPKKSRVSLGFTRYIVFILSFLLVGGMVLLSVSNMSEVMLWLFILGNLIYYIVGIILAFALEDNRAFCKYICPITIFLKPASYYSFMRIKCDDEKCINCGRCKSVCPMDVDMMDNSRKRLNGTECILCISCVEECPVKALSL